MVMGRRKGERQEALFVTADALPKSPGHPFYRALNRLLAEAGFGRWIEERCRPFYVDLGSDLILAAEIRQATEHDSHTLTDSVMQAQQHLRSLDAEQLIEEIAADKGYDSADSLEQCQSLHFRTYIPEPKRHTDWTWTDRSAEQQRAVHGNRQRVRRSKGKRLQRRRSELCEWTFAHVCDTGGMRRTWLKGLVDVTKRYVIAAAAHNLGRILRTLFGLGRPRGLQGGQSAGEFAPSDHNPIRWLVPLRAWLTSATPHRAGSASQAGAA